MVKLVRNIYYLLAFGLSTVVSGFIWLSSKKGIDSAVSFGMMLSYVLIALGLLAAILLSIKNLIDKPKSAIMTLSGVILMLVLIGIGYSLDDHTLRDNYANYGVKTEKASGIIGGSLIATWIILISTVVLTLVASAINMIKKL